MKKKQKRGSLISLSINASPKKVFVPKKALGILYGALALCLTFVPISNAYAQQNIVVSGKVTDSFDEPLMGVTVLLKGSNNGVVTNFDGMYTVKGVPNNGTLVYTFIGMKSQEISIASRNSIDVKMEEDIIGLEETVVIGYGSVKKKDLLGAVSTIKEKALSERKSGNVIESMQGLTTGVKVTTSGQPGANATIRIRGLGSLTNNNPLFIIDGAYAGDDLGVNVEDIESIQVLKDASSAAIYGSRAANGVVIITTKQGKEGKMKVKFDTQLTLNWLPRYDLMDAETYKIYNDRAYDEAILAGVSGVTKRQNHFDGNTDWQEEMLRSGVLRNYNVSLSGGSENGKFYTSLNRLVDEGALYKTGYDKYGFRVNTSGKKGIFSYGENFYYTKSDSKILNGNPWENFIRIPPTIPVYDESNPGGYGYGNVDGANSFGLNPIAMQDLYQRNNEEEYFTGNIYGQVSLFDDMLDAKLNFAYQSYMGVTNSLRKSGSWTMGQGDDSASLGYNSAKNSDMLIEQTFNFKKQFGKHDLKALVGGSYNKFRTDGRWITKQDPLLKGDEYITSLDAATGDATAGGSYGESALISYFGRVNYSYADKYLAQVTARRDGTSRLPEDTRWENFYSGSIGWRISGEDFFDLSFINDFKLRGSYGTLGNSSIGFWDYQSVINIAPRAVFGSPEYQATGMTQSRLSNNDLIWEKKTTANLGFDLTTFNNRLNLSAEYFYSKSEDLLVYLPILMSSGNEGGAPAVNAGSLENRGIEVELGWRNQIKDFSYTASLNVSHLKNKVTNLGYGQTVLFTALAKTEIGEPLGTWYLYKMNGIFQSESDVNNHVSSSGQVIQPNALPGDIIYDDYNDDGIISSEDRQIAGSPWADFELGLNLGASYKGIDLGINGYGRFGQEIWNGSAASASDFANNQNNFNGLKPWTQEHPVNDRPRIVYGDSRNSRGDQDRWLEDGSFFRISQITLGYTFPSLLCEKLGMENIRASLTGQNLVTFTKYSGLDPEFTDNGIFQIGADYSSFPNPRSVQFAVSFTF
ncbi:SusC/RagA family TonB-linked outer membrane protein [Mariniflexile maritimum]|uniref:SusC/RagA family TonB-linked outer membrane protein n=1 Tax=Mariniflexile maritimum TaxID=2682493 RepID=UPI0012F699C4|nr:TonB-dependent receptor [Mariniflexile maritimum]